MKRLSILGSVAALVLALIPFLLPPVAQAATVRCYGVVSGAQKPPPYPVDATNPTLDAGHYRECFQNPDAATLQRIGNVASYLKNLNSVGSGAGAQLQGHAVTFYFFATRDDYNSYVDDHYGSGIPGVHSKYYTATARCGNTYHAPGLPVISAVWDKCFYATGQSADKNAGLVEAMKHESGHAFSIAVGLNFGDGGPGGSAGFAAETTSGIVQDDLNRFDKVWKSQSTLALKNSYLCLIAGHGNVLTPLEKDLGTTLICPGGTLTAKYSGMKPSAVLSDAIPYFFNRTPPAGGSAPFNEIWANLMISDTGGPGGSEVMPQTNYVLGQMACAPNVNKGYYLTGAAPQTNDPRYNACQNSFVPPNPNTFR